MHSKIFLIGFMGSGKSTHGSILAKKLGYGFEDMDHIIGKTAGMTIPEIFSEFGEGTFRKWEHRILLELCSIEKNLVISTGGGAPCSEKMIQLMNNRGCTIYIKMDPSALFQRLSNSRTKRPLIENKTETELLEYIQTLLAHREQYYNQATYTVDGINLQTETLVNLVKPA